MSETQKPALPEGRVFESRRVSQPCEVTLAGMTFCGWAAMASAALGIIEMGGGGLLVIFGTGALVVWYVRFRRTTP